ncbi:MAG: energy transducer TonB [Paracoccaceae bacterium]
MASSSGAASLDQAALRAAQAVGRYPPPPPELGGDRFSFVVAMAFRLQ